MLLLLLSSHSTRRRKAAAQGQSERRIVPYLITDHKTAKHSLS